MLIDNGGRDARTRSVSLTPHPAATRRGHLARAGGGTGAGEALRQRLLDAIRRLESHPRDRKFARALWLTYAEPALKQEQVAVELGIPFPTYRYRLQRGIALLATVVQEEGGRR